MIECNLYYNYLLQNVQSTQRQQENFEIQNKEAQNWKHFEMRFEFKKRAIIGYSKNELEKVFLGKLLEFRLIQVF